MKLILTLFTLFLTTVSFAQITTKSISAVPLIEDRVYELDGGFFVLGTSRVLIPIDLPENTLEWYYVFTSYSNEDLVSSNAAGINLLSQLSRIIDQSGTTAEALSFLLAPTGSSASNVYLFTDHTNAINFVNKTDQDIFPTYWSARLQGTIKSATQGKQRITETSNSRYYIGIQAGTSPVIVHIEIVAIVDESTTDMTVWSAEMHDLIKDIVKDELIESEIPELAAIEMADCTIDKITKDYTPAVFFDFSEDVLNKIIGEYYKVCAEKIDGAETEEQKKGITYGNLAWDHYENGNLDKAIEYSKKALELHKDLGWVQTNLGLFYLIKGDDATATDYYIEAIFDLKNDKLGGKDYLKAAMDDINNARKKYPEMKGYEAILDELKREYEGF
jgi:tetratricopeptide (TPR) repeat protein